MSSKDRQPTGRKRLLISFSGGETSALMAFLCTRNNEFRSQYDEVRTVFANTGLEREETLEFVDRVDREFGLQVTWIEAYTPAEAGQGTQARVVDFATAARQGEPMERIIAKYGIPGPSRPLCSKESKGVPISKWARSIGWELDTYDLAIGIRSDEVDRMTSSHRKRNVIYPLIRWFPQTKPSVSEFWARQPFRLQLKSYEGNCATCWKKSRRKLMTIMRENPHLFEPFERWQEQYAFAGPGSTGEAHRFFRENLTVADIRRLAAETDFEPAADESREYDLSLLDMIALGTVDVDLEFDVCGSESCEVDFEE